MYNHSTATLKTSRTMDENTQRDLASAVAKTSVLATQRAALGAIGQNQSSSNENQALKPANTISLKHHEGPKPSRGATDKENFVRPSKNCKTVLQPKNTFNIYCDEESLVDEEVMTVDGAHVKDTYDATPIGDDSLRILEQTEALFDSSSNHKSRLERSSGQDCLSSEDNETFGSQVLMNFSEYTDEVFAYLLNYERKFKVDAEYMSRQPEVNSKMRSILVDWMTEVSDEYKLHNETLFLAISMIDRFLSTMSIARQSFQLLGTAALFVASKYEEIYPPDINEFVYITDDSYTKYQVLNMEKLLLKAVQFDVSAPTIHYFLHKFLITLEFPEYVNHLAEYLCHLTLLEGEVFLKYLPSEIATSSAIVAANTFSLPHLLKPSYFDKALKMQSEAGNVDKEHVKARLDSCMADMIELQRIASDHPQQAIFQKFSTDRFYTVALIDPLTASPSYPQ